MCLFSGPNFDNEHHSQHEKALTFQHYFVIIRDMEDVTSLSRDWWIYIIMEPVKENLQYDNPQMQARQCFYTAKYRFNSVVSGLNACLLFVCQ